MHLRGQAARKRQRGFASGLAQTPIRAAHRCFFVRLLGRALVSAARVSASPLVSRLSHIFMDTQLLIIAFLRIRTLDKLFEATIALVNFRICN